MRLRLPQLTPQLRAAKVASLCSSKRFGFRRVLAGAPPLAQKRRARTVTVPEGGFRGCTTVAVTGWLDRALSRSSLSRSRIRKLCASSAANDLAARVQPKRKKHSHIYAFRLPSPDAQNWNTCFCKHRHIADCVLHDSRNLSKFDI